MTTGEAEDEELVDGEDEGIEPLLVYIRDHRAFDFTCYNRASLVRRIRKRMQDVRAATYPATTRSTSA